MGIWNIPLGLQLYKMNLSDFVLSFSDLLGYVMSYIDSRYEKFYSSSENNGNSYRYDCLVIFLHTFRCLYDEIYLHRNGHNINILSTKSKFVNSHSLCLWSIEMGIDTNNSYGSICSLVCRSKNLSVLQNIVCEYPNWKPS